MITSYYEFMMVEQQTDIDNNSELDDCESEVVGEANAEPERGSTGDYR